MKYALVLILACAAVFVLQDRVEAGRGWGLRRMITVRRFYKRRVVLTPQHRKVDFQHINPRLSPAETKAIQEEIKRDIRRKCKEWDISELEYYLRAV